MEFETVHRRHDRHLDPAYDAAQRPHRTDKATLGESATRVEDLRVLRDAGVPWLRLPVRGFGRQTDAVSSGLRLQYPAQLGQSDS